ncbi:MAG: alpha/beta hydrolase [Caldiserica bacterium]|nr:alpha/beta hydrolase [Caldisericota bacterium]
MFWEKYYQGKEKFSLLNRVKEGEKEKIILKGSKETLELDLFSPATPRYPLLIFIHGLGITEKKKDFLLRSFLPLVKNGHPLLFYTLPGHLSRKQGNKKDNWRMDDAEFLRFFVQSVKEIRGLMDWFGEEQFDVLGISMGGMIGTVAMAMDERVQKGVFLLTGGNLEKILWRGVMRFVLPKDCDRETCHMLHLRYQEILEKGRLEELAELPRFCFLYDPLTFAHLLRGKDVLMVNGLLDGVINLSSAYELRRRMGNPSWLLFPGTHISLPLFLPLLRKRIEKFLQVSR